MGGAYDDHGAGNVIVGGAYNDHGPSDVIVGAGLTMTMGQVMRVSVWAGLPMTIGRVMRVSVGGAYDDRGADDVQRCRQHSLNKSSGRI